MVSRQKNIVQILEGAETGRFSLLTAPVDVPQRLNDRIEYYNGFI